MNTPMTPTAAQVANQIERLVRAADNAQSDWYAADAVTALGQAVGDHAALIVRALRALDEPSAEKVERAGRGIAAGHFDCGYGEAYPCQNGSGCRCRQDARAALAAARDGAGEESHGD